MSVLIWLGVIVLGPIAIVVVLRVVALVLRTVAAVLEYLAERPS